MRKVATSLLGAMALAGAAGEARAEETVLWTTGATTQCGGTQSLICAQWTLLLTGPNSYKLTILNTGERNSESVFKSFALGDGDAGTEWSVDAASFQSQGGMWSLENLSGDDNPWNGFGMFSIVFSASTDGNPNQNGIGAGESVWFTWNMTSDPAGGQISELGIHDLKGLRTESDKAVFETVVPEPSTIALFATGLIGVIGIGRRRVRSARK